MEGKYMPVSAPQQTPTESEDFNEKFPEKLQNVSRDYAGRHTDPSGKCNGYHSCRAHCLDRVRGRGVSAQERIRRTPDPLYLPRK